MSIDNEITRNEQGEEKKAQWYAVHTYSGYEEKVMNLLNKTVAARKWEDKIQDIRVPKVKTIEIKDGKKEQGDTKVLPGYVFIKFVSGFDTLMPTEEPSAEDKELWYVIRNTRGVTGFVSSNPNRPLPITDPQDLKILGVEAPEAPEVVYTIDFNEGDTVKVTDGPFKDSICIVDKISSDKHQVIVRISMFGRETPVSLDFTQVEKI